MEVLSRSGSFFYDTLKYQIRFRESLNEKDLLPLHCEAILSYYGIQNSDARSLCEDLNSVAQEVVKRVGFEEAIGRFAALPMPLPRCFVEEFAAEDDHGRKNRIHAVLRKGPSPVHRFHALRLASAVDGPLFCRLGRRLLRTLLSETGDLESRAYLAVLNWTAAAIGRTPVAATWSRATRLFATWAHGTQVFAIYRRERLPFIWFEEEFGKRVGDQLLNDLETSFSKGRDVGDPSGVSVPELLLTGIAYGNLGTQLPDDLAIKGRELWFDRSGEYPLPTLWAVPGLAPNALSAFTGEPLLEALSTLLGPEVGSGFNADFRDTVRTQSLAAIVTEEQRVAGWIGLAALFCASPPPEEDAHRIEEGLSALDFLALAASDRDSERARGLSLISGRLPHVQDEAVRESITRSLVRLAAWYGANDGTETEARHLVTLVLSHAWPIPLRNRSMEGFSDLCLQVAERFQKFVPVCREAVHRLCHDYPPHEASVLWLLAVRLRAMN